MKFIEIVYSVNRVQIWRLIILKSKVDSNDFIVEYNHITSKDMVEEVKQLFLEYANSLKVDLAFQNFEEELISLPGKSGSPNGDLILASVDGKASGCIALRYISEYVCEMKRLYVRDDYRGLGIGKRLVTMIIEEAVRLKYNYIRLDTMPTLKRAQSLYTSLGFYDIEPYTFNPIKGARFMELKLDNIMER